MKWLKAVFLRDYVDFIIFIIALFGFVWWIVTRTVYFDNHNINIRTLINMGGVLLMVASYIFYVMYRFAVLYAKMDKYITDPEARRMLGLDK